MAYYCGKCGQKCDPDTAVIYVDSTDYEALISPCHKFSVIDERGVPVEAKEIDDIFNWLDRGAMAQEK